VYFRIFCDGGQLAASGPEQGVTRWSANLLKKALTIVIYFSGKRDWHMVYTAAFRNDVVL